MAMVRKDGKLPANARVDVDYTGKKPKISFSYPKLPANKKDKKRGKKWSSPKKDAENQNFLGRHTLVLLLFFTVIGAVIYLNTNTWNEYPTDCEVVLDQAITNFTLETNLIDYISNNITTASVDFNSSKVKGADFYCNDNTTHYRVYFDPMDDVFGLSHPGFYRETTGGIRSELFPTARFLLCFFIFMFVFGKINMLITKWIVKKPWYQKWLPEHNAKVKTKKYKKFTAKDFDEDTSPFIEIPYFKNVSIEYNTFGDFSARLKKIKIREHRYNYYDAKKKKVGKLKVEIMKWTARFYFDKVPKDGYMEAIYY